jgi:hypothetical protein
MERRRLTSVRLPRKEKEQFYFSFACYDKNGEFTGENEYVFLTEDELYEVLRPRLKRTYRDWEEVLLRHEKSRKELKGEE